VTALLQSRGCRGEASGTGGAAATVRTAMLGQRQAAGHPPQAGGAAQIPPSRAHLHLPVIHARQRQAAAAVRRHALEKNAAAAMLQRRGIGIGAAVGIRKESAAASV
jgi:hypothetical protein